MCAIADRRCTYGVVGPFRPDCHLVGESKKISQVETLWEVVAQKVKPLYT